MKPFGDVEEVHGVTIERQPELLTGWAVFSGTEGDSPAFFAFVKSRQVGEALLAVTTADGEALVFDGAIVPAVVLGNKGASTGLYVANHSDDKESRRALCARFGLSPDIIW